MNKRFLIAAILLGLLVFLIPIEHSYGNLIRFFSLQLIHEGLELSRAYDKKLYFYVSDIIGLIFLCWGMAQIPLKRFFASPLWIVFLCALGSIIASPFAYYPVAYSRLLQLLTPIALFSFVAHGFADEEKPRITRWVLMALVMAGLFQSGIAIAQYFNQAPLGLRILSEPTILGSFMVQDGSRWLFDRLFHHTPPTDLIYRASGTLPHPNVLGGFLMSSILATYALAMRPKGKLIALTLPIQFFAMSLSYSRAALFAWMLGTAVWYGCIFFKKIKNWEFLAWMIALSVTLTAILLYDQVRHRGGVVNYNKLAQRSDAIRLFHQRNAFEIIRQNPVLGVGFGQFSERSHKYFPTNSGHYELQTGPHNIYLFLACETGLLALTAFLAFIGILLWRAIKIPLTAEVITLLSGLIAFLFIGFCDFYPILFQQGKLLFFTIAALLAAQTKLVRREPFLCESP